MVVSQRRLSLDDFLTLPEQEPELELEPDGTVIQKVSPRSQHSRLQLILCERINRIAEPSRLALAFPAVSTGALEADRRTRDRLIHGYEAIDLDVVWAIATGDLPLVIEQIDRGPLADQG